MLESYVLKFPKVVYSGKDAISKVEQVAKDFGATKACVVTDKGLLERGLCDKAIDILKGMGIGVEIIQNIPPEPSYLAVQEVVDQFRGMGANMIVAIGGGSVMDAAKLISVLATDKYQVKDLLDNPGLAHKQVKTLMVPTTAGTGSEATPNAIVAVPEKNVKIGIVNDDLICDAVILDDVMIRNLPRSIAANTGIDALCHAIECYTCVKANPFSDTFALHALDLILANIVDACDDKDAVEAKRAMQLASFYAGIAITASGTTAVHGLSYPLGGRYHIAHGVSNAMLLVPVMRFNKPAIKERLASAYDQCVRGDAQGVDAKADALVDLLDELVKHLDIPTSVRQLGVEDADLEWLVSAGLEQRRLLDNNVREVTADDARAIYQQIL